MSLQGSPCFVSGQYFSRAASGPIFKSWALAPAALLLAAAALFATGPAFAQYPGQVSKKNSDKIPELRAIAVLEWTGEAGKPKASRIVPVSIYNGEHLEDAGLYLARPQPLALAGEVEYELKQNGHTVGLFDIKNSGQEEGSWVGYGEWKPMPAPKADASARPPKLDDDDYSADDKPVLHRKQKSDSSTKSGGGSTAPAPQTGSDDSDRPTLHKKTDDSSSQGNSGGSAPGSEPGSASGTAPGTSSGTSAESSSDNTSSDPDRPVMKKPKKSKEPEDIGHVNSVAGFTDPDRPRLKRGMSNFDSLKVLPTLMGLPPDMQQAVAVSDVHNRPDHPWSYAWANPEDEGKMKAQMEDIARMALGIAHPAPPAAQAKTGTKSGTAAGAAHHAVTARKAAPAPPPAPLEDEQFRVFELAYGSGATMVLTAQTPGPLATQRFVTLIAQPDLYGKVLVLFKQVTDGAHLDETPRMRLVDAVDALADNRGELLFELRGETSRQFALYRVLRGSADKIFESFGSNFGTVVSE